MNDADKIFAAYMQSVYGARKRAIKKSSEQDLSKGEAEALWLRCNGKCEVTGIPFSLDNSDTGSTRRPWAPSIDQIESGKGYTIANVRVVCIAVNIAMNQWGENVLYRIAVCLLTEGKMGHITTSTHHATSLPMDVRLYRGRKNVRYMARARDFGRDVHLGNFQVLDDALDARHKWAIENRSVKVLRQLYDFSRAPSLLTEIKNLSPEKATLSLAT